jgi:uncharacterized membrane protein
LIVATSAALIAPAVVFGIPSNLDLSNHFRFALPFHHALQAGDLYPGWLAESNAGYGDASFRFYPPALYYLLSAARFLTGNWYDSVLVTFALIFYLGALSIYGWARSLFSPGVAAWSAILFSVTPYHLNQFYQATLLAEFAACSVLPFAFWQLERICQRQSLRNVAGLSIGFSLLVLTHLPLTVIGSIALVVYGIVRLKKDVWQRSLLLMASGAGLGLLASACFWVTMLAEKFWIRADRIKPNSSVDFRKNFIFSTFSTDNLNVWWMNILVLFSFALFCPALILLHRKTRRSSGIPTSSLGIMFLFTLAMSTWLALPLWMMLKPLQETQFPWRWLGLLSMFGSLLTAAAIPEWRKIASGRWRPLCLIVMSGIVISIAFSASHIIGEAKFLSPQEFNNTLERIPGTDSVRQWLPVWASNSPQNMDGEVSAGRRTVRIADWQPEMRVFDLSPGTEQQARIKTFYYPHWKATAAGNELSVTPAEDGAMLVSLPQEAVTVTLKFVEPMRTRVAAFVTLVGWLLIGITFLVGCSPGNTPALDL